MSFGGINRFRLWALAGVSAAAIVSPAWAQDAVKEFNIPAQEMTTALETFGKQSDTDLIFDRAKISGRTSAALSGKLTPLEALTRLTTGSGLAVRRVNATSFIVEPAAFQGKAANGGLEDTVEIVVTGSHIRNANPTSPVHVLSRKDIEESGYSQIGDVVRSLPENFSGGQNPGVLAGASAANPGNTNGSNASTFNLRGIGSDATLVLLNGHRLAADYSFQGSDISGIPLAAVSRIEVVTDGASALYGADAVAGVANIIMRKNYEGAELSVRTGIATQGGGLEQTASALSGFKRGNWYALVNIESSEQKAIYARQRDFASNAAPTNTLSWPTTRRSMFLSSGIDLTDRTTFSIDALVSDRKTESATQYSLDTPLYRDTGYTPAYSVALTLDTHLPWDWRLRVTGVSSGSRNSLQGYEITPTETFSSLTQYRNYSRYFEVITDGTLFSLPSGPVKAAIGLGQRQEGFQLNAPGSPSYIKPSRTVNYAFAETSLPLVVASDERFGLNELELSASARVEDYSDFGKASSPRIGLRYKPFNALTLRGTWGKSFKAPSYAQAYGISTVYYWPRAFFSGTGTGTILMAYGGNRELQPEKSRSWTFGGEFAPASIRTLRLSATYFEIDFSGRVVQPISNVFAAFTDPAYAPFIQYNPSASDQTRIIAQSSRFSNATGHAYDPSDVGAIIYNNYQNGTSQSIKGVDLAYRQAFQLDSATLSVFANATSLTLKQKTLVTSPEVTLSGTIFNPPKFKARGGLTWNQDQISATVLANYVASEADTGSSPATTIASWTTIDANVVYRFSGKSRLTDNLKFTLAASNLFDRDPPRANSAGVTLNGIYYDSTNTSLVGRFVSLTVTKAW